MLPILAAYTAAQFATAAKQAMSGCPVAHGARRPSIMPEGSPEPSTSGNPNVWLNPYANARPLTDAEREIITATVPVLAQVGVTLTTKFYERMLGNHKHLNHIFNQAHQATGMQPKALAAAVVSTRKTRGREEGRMTTCAMFCFPHRCSPSQLSSSPFVFFSTLMLRTSMI